LKQQLVALNAIQVILVLSLTHRCHVIKLRAMQLREIVMRVYLNYS